MTLGLRMASMGFLMPLLASCSTSGAQSDHFNGSSFFNPEGGDHTFSDSVKWMWEMEAVSWPSWLEDPPHPPPPARVPRGALRVTYINHATVLIQINGLNIVTDPIWSDYAGLTPWLGVRRVRAPGVAFDSLPPIDLVLVSHDHFDHLDLPTLERLARRDRPRFVVGLGVSAALKSIGIDERRIVELDWWQQSAVEGSDLRLVFVPARHGSGRGPFSQRSTLWGGFVIDAPEGAVYFAGDTGLGQFVDELAARFDRVRVALLPIGSYEKRWIMKTQHMNPDDAVQVHRKLRALQSVGMHFGTFAEHPEQAIDAHEKDLASALASQKVEPGRFWVLGFGEGRDVPPLERPSAPDATR